MDHSTRALILTVGEGEFLMRRVSRSSYLRDRHCTVEIVPHSEPIELEGGSECPAVAVMVSAAQESDMWIGVGFITAIVEGVVI